MASSLRKNKDWEVISLGYPSGEADVAAHAKSLANVISHLDGAEEIDLVAHSLGNIVIRHYWADQTDLANKKTPDPRIKRIVMVGPPNKGAILAQKYGANKLYENFAGKSGRQLTRGWGELEKKLATPTCEFGIIAGGKRDDIGFNPLIPGDDDLLVTVEETKLAGARDFLLLPVTHAGQMRRPEIQNYTRNFLEKGYFVSEKERHPITEKGVETVAAEKVAEKPEKAK
jgi:pimeloyl-ACP methyl ester carboxylesterase